jgi:cytochrome c
MVGSRKIADVTHGYACESHPPRRQRRYNMAGGQTLMKKMILFTMLLSLVFASAAMAAEDGAALYKAKCAACHGPDGKKMAKADLSSAAVQGLADTELVTFVGENAKHNFTKKGLSADQIKAVVTFLRTLK